MDPFSIVLFSVLELEPLLANALVFLQPMFIFFYPILIQHNFSTSLLAKRVLNRGTKKRKMSSYTLADKRGHSRAMLVMRSLLALGRPLLLCLPYYGPTGSPYTNFLFCISRKQQPQTHQKIYLDLHILKAIIIKVLEYKNNQITFHS